MAQARREANTQQMAERKNVIGESGGVGMVFFNLQFRFVVEQTVEYIRGISYGRIDELGSTGSPEAKDAIARGDRTNPPLACKFLRTGK